MPKSRLVSTVLNLIKLVERKVRRFFYYHTANLLDFKIFTEKIFVSVFQLCFFF